ncbi:MAG: tetratricopeptide repeat protein, partial [Burkholderiales bacterium]
MVSGVNFGKRSVMVQNRRLYSSIAQPPFHMQDAKAFFERGLERHVARDWRAAEAAYRRALELAPGRPSLLFNLGRLMLDLRRDGEAESFFSKVVASSPPDVEALGGLGESLARQGRHADALQCHARALAIAPDTSQMQANFARCAAYAHLRPDRLDLDLLEPALRVCLESDAVDHQSLAAVVSAVLQAKHPATRGLMEDGLVLLGLAKVIVANARDEELLTALRRGLLLSGVPEQAEAFACALACQCFLNEY